VNALLKKKMKPLPSMPGESNEECIARMKKEGTYYENRVEYKTTRGASEYGGNTDDPVRPDGDGWTFMEAECINDPSHERVLLFWFWTRTVKVTQIQLAEETTEKRSGPYSSEEMMKWIGELECSLGINSPCHRLECLAALHQLQNEYVESKKREKELQKRLDASLICVKDWSDSARSLRTQAISMGMTSNKCRLCEHRWSVGQPESHAPNCKAQP
jgi:hypothetical protein